MKVAILAGGVGSRLAEETVIKPKPMVEIGGLPILLHIMRYYAHYGFRDFVIGLGYKGEVIKKYFSEHDSSHASSIVGSGGGRTSRPGGDAPDWTVELIDTGRDTQTGGRLKRLAPFLDEETFLLTWGDGVSTVDLYELIAFHRSHGKLATLTAVRPPARFGRLELDGNRVAEFCEKPRNHESWINGAFFVLERAVLDLIEGDACQFERGPLPSLARRGELMAYRHEGFWQCMDTVCDKAQLEHMWAGGRAPWKVWGEGR